MRRALFRRTARHNGSMTSRGEQKPKDFKWLSQGLAGPPIGRAGATNAGLLAAGVLALSDKALAQRLETWREQQTASVAVKPKDEA